ncbi:hypothetical protein CYMTET_24233 [Cymbomonas tetramitiformis]|uniref:Uncharacterized protein n=1 Tax=Cymbomonas tetramitiformis TaxID=36881 RepID=A0AAE0L0F7_9CHLO|nr:hypothetical protein CYMTET_24233 [Cymbomonas tetramitiformis]
MIGRDGGAPHLVGDIDLAAIGPAVAASTGGSASGSPPAPGALKPDVGEVAGLGASGAGEDRSNLPGTAVTGPSAGRYTGMDHHPFVTISPWSPGERISSKCLGRLIPVCRARSSKSTSTSVGRREGGEEGGEGRGGGGGGGGEGGGWAKARRVDPVDVVDLKLLQLPGGGAEGVDDVVSPNESLAAIAGGILRLAHVLGGAGEEGAASVFQLTLGGAAAHESQVGLGGQDPWEAAEGEGAGGIPPCQWGEEKPEAVREENYGGEGGGGMAEEERGGVQYGGEGGGEEGRGRNYSTKLVKVEGLLSLRLALLLVLLLMVLRGVTLLKVLLLRWRLLLKGMRRVLMRHPGGGEEGGVL